MPKPEEAKKEEEIASEITENEDGGVSVSVEGDEPQKEVLGEIEEKPKHKPEQDSFKNKIYAQDRIINKMTREMDDLRNQISTLTPSQKTEELSVELDEIDKLAQKDWKAAVNKLAETKFQQLKDDDNRKIQAENERISVAQRLEENAQKALGKHPELNDNTSEKSQLWFSILEKNPNWRNSPDGPLLAMHEMEDELRARGYDVGTRSETPKPRVSTTLPPSRPVPSSKVVLTREQREFCDTNGITYEAYARTLKNSGETRGVEI